MADLVLMSDPRVAGLAVEESGEPLVDLEAAGVMRFSDRKRAPNPHLAFVREGLARRLVRASELLPAGIHFLGIEAFRPLSLQRLFYDTYAERLRRERPEVGPEELAQLVSRFVAPPETAPHPSGAAIDLTLCDQTGAELDLGSPLDATPEASSGACFTAAPGLDAVAAANRAILVRALTEAGLVNYPTEWWHWSFGDRYWAMSTGRTAAIHGPAQL